MKILYIGSERSGAETVATALCDIAQNVAVSWASRIDLAARWLDENRDVAALVIEAQIDGGWPSVLKHVEGLAWRPPVVVIVPEGTRPQFEALTPKADDYIAKNDSLLRDLPIVVGLAVARARAYQRSKETPDRTARQSAAGQEVPNVMAVPARIAAQPEARPTAVNAAHDDLRQSAAESPTARDRTELTSSEAPATPAQRHTQSEGLVGLERSKRAELEQKLARATAALQEAEQRHLAAMAAATEQLADRQVKYELASARAAATWEMVDEQLRAAAIEVERARQNHASAAADVDRLSRRESELSALLAEAAATSSVLERRLANAETAVEAANKRTEHERVADAERQREFQAQIAQEVDKRRSVEDRLAEAVGALDDAEKRHAAAITSAFAESRELEEALRLARQDLQSKAVDVDRLTKHEADLTSMLADAATNRNDLERRLAATEAAFHDADTRATRERLEASKRAAEREAELDGQIRQERAARAALERAVEDGEAALRDAQQRHDVALAAAANELAERHAHFDRELSQTGADRDRLSQRLSEVEGALDLARRDHQSAVADVERLTQREGDLTSQLAALEANRQTLEGQLADAARAVADADERAARERAAAAGREAELDRQIRQERATRAVLEEAIADGDAALRAAQQRHDAALAAAANELAEHQAQFDRELSQTGADRDRLSQRLSEVEGALDLARRDHQSAAADVERLTEREADLTSQLAGVSSELAGVQSARDVLELRLGDAERAIQDAAAREAELEAQERATRAVLEQVAAEAEAALLHAQQRHDAALATAGNELAERQSHFDRELSQTVADRDRLSQRLSEVEGTLDQSRRDHQSAAADVERLTQHEAELTSQLANLEAACHNLEQKLTDAARAITGADERATHERAVAADRQADLEARLGQALDTHDTLERTLAETRSAALEAERLLHQKIEDLRAGGLEQEARFQAQFAQQRREHESRLAEMGQRTRDLALERDLLQQSLATSQEQSHRRDIKHRETRERLEQAGLAADADIRRLTASLSETERTLEDARRDFRATLDRLSTEHATALAALNASVAERDAQLQEQSARYTASLQSAERARTELQDGFQETLAARDREIGHFQQKLAATVRELEATKRVVQTLQIEADKVPRLQEELGQSRAESGRLFQQAGLAMVRCGGDGRLTQANRAWLTLVGRRTIDELRGAPFAAAVFEDPNALHWLIERCLSTRTKESIETTWRRKDGGRLFVRLSAYASSTDLVEIVAEDLTRLHVLQERLGQAHRMEAVGRLAAEIAITCGNLLSDVQRNVREWLMTAGGNAASRQQGELLLDEVTRAAGFLQQLAAYGDEQARTPAVTDLNTIIRDLEPVLKRVAGDSVEIQLPGTTSPLNVDVGTERIERLLVNLASYGRERMPFGGQLRFELGTTVVDRRFTARYPNVRLGLHALITVTESKRTAQADGLLQLRDGKPANSAAGIAAPKPGLDIGALQRLVGEGGGHLWLTVQPGGDMVAKIHLPLLTPYRQTVPRTLTTRGVRERTLARWFQH